jgi:hypothetical protein
VQSFNQVLTNLISKHSVLINRNSLVLTCHSVGGRFVRHSRHSHCPSRLPPPAPLKQLRSYTAYPLLVQLKLIITVLIKTKQTRDHSVALPKARLFLDNKAGVCTVYARGITAIVALNEADYMWILRLY